MKWESGLAPSPLLPKEHTSGPPVEPEGLEEPSLKSMGPDALFQHGTLVTAVSLSVGHSRRAVNPLSEAPAQGTSVRPHSDAKNEKSAFFFLPGEKERR